MKMKQLFCLLVLTVSGNTFGSSTTPAMNVADTANQHFAPLMQGMSMQNPLMIRINELCKPYMHPDLMKQHIQIVQDAYQEGVRAGLMAAGTHTQAMMTAMGNVMKAPKSDMATIAKAQGIK